MWCLSEGGVLQGARGGNVSHWWRGVGHWLKRVVLVRTHGEWGARHKATSASTWLTPTTRGEGVQQRASEVPHEKVLWRAWESVGSIANSGKPLFPPRSEYENCTNKLRSEDMQIDFRTRRTA